MFIAVTSCTKVDDKVGFDFIPNGQHMQVKIDTLSGVETYLSLTDSLTTSNLGYMFIGNQSSPVYGTTTLSAVATYLPYSYSDSTLMQGNRITADSLFFASTVTYLGGESTTEQSFLVYGLNERIYADSMYYANFPADENIGSEPLFSFTYSGKPSSSSNTAIIKWTPSSAGAAYIQQLVGADSTIYNNDSLFLNRFRGLYITPQNKTIDGAVYRFSLDSALLYLYAHTYVEGSLVNEVKDTVALSYTLTDDHTNYTNNPLASIGVFKHDYSACSYFAAINDTLSIQPTVYVQGFGGITSQLRFGDEFLSQLDALVPENQNIVINQAIMLVDVKDSSIPMLDAAPVRLGSYYKYANLSPMEDYYYPNEVSSTSGYTLPYGGYLNRSNGRYSMNITSYIQGSLVRRNTFYKRQRFTLAPAYTTLYRPQQVALEGLGSGNPIKVAVTYTLIK